MQIGGLEKQIGYLLEQQKADEEEISKRVEESEE